LGCDIGQATEAEIRRTAKALLDAQGFSEADLVLDTQWVDEIGFLHVIFDQKLGGIPVADEQVRVHFDPDGNLGAVSGIARRAAHAKRSKTPKLTSVAAHLRCLERTKASNKKAEGERLVFVTIPETDDFALAWEVMVTGDTPELPVAERVFVDAETGDEICRRSHIFGALDRQIWDYNYGVSPRVVRTETWAANPMPTREASENFSHMGAM
jgi:Zn-dependent metalloprotease